MTWQESELKEFLVEHGCVLVSSGEVGDQRYERLLREAYDLHDRGLASARYLERGFRIALTEAGRRWRAGQA